MKKNLLLLAFIFFLTVPARFARGAEPGSLPSIKTPVAARVPPLFWYEYDPEARRRFMMALLLYWGVKDPSGQFDLLAPIFYRSVTPDEKFSIFLPLHFSYRTPETESALWGLYYQKKSLRETTRFLFPLYLHHSSNEGSLTYLTLYFALKNPKIAANILFPLFWSLHFEDTQKSYQTLFPFYLRLKDGKLNSRTFLSPFFYSYRDPTVSQGFVPPYYWQETSSSTLEVGFPLYWRFRWLDDENRAKDFQMAIPWFRYRNENGSLRGLVPLYWGRTRIFREEYSTATSKQEWNLFFPLYFSVDKPNGTHKIITPLYSRFHDQDGREWGHTGLNFFSRDVWGGRTEGMIPMFYYRREADFFKLRFLALYLFREQKDEHSETSVFPIFRYRRDTDRKQFLTWGFYHDRDPDVSRGLMLAYFWRTDYQPDDPMHRIVSRKRFLIPLAWHFKSENESTTVFPPLVAFHHHPDYDLSLVAPFYFHRKKENDDLTVIPPMITRRNPEREWTSLFFLAWKSEKEEGQRSAFTFLPLYRYSKFPNGYSVYLPGFYYLREGNETQGVAIPYLWDHRGKTQYEMVPPLYVHFRRPTWFVKSVFPYYRVETKDFREKGIFPIWARTIASPESTGTVKHFLADSHRVLPFYFYRKLDNGYDLYLPFLLGHIEKGLTEKKEPSIRGRLLLVSYWEKWPNHFVNRIDPLFSYVNSPERKGYSIPSAPFPLWQHETEWEVQEDKSPEWVQEKGAYFPYYWKNTRTMRRDLVLPVFYQRKEKDPEGKKDLSKITWLLAYYSSQNYEELREKTFVVPFYWHIASKDEKLTVAPPVWKQYGPDFRREIVFPFWWMFERGKDRTSVFFPFFLKASNETEHRSTLIVPGYWQRKDPENFSFLAGTFYRRKSLVRDESTMVAFPIFWSMRAPEKSTLTFFPLLWNWREGESRITYLFPLYFAHKREHLDWKVTFPLYWDFKTDETEVKVLPPYFSIVSAVSGTKTSGFAPFWSYSRNPKEDWRNFQIFGGLFGYERHGDQKKITLFYVIEI